MFYGLCFEILCRQIIIPATFWDNLCILCDFVSWYFLYEVVFLRLIFVNLRTCLIHLLNVITLQFLSLLKFSNLNFINENRLTCVSDLSEADCPFSFAKTDSHQFQMIRNKQLVQFNSRLFV